jgi:hypothetical protein
MSWNLIDFPPWRKSRGPFEDVPFLAQDLVLAPQPLQLSHHVLLAVFGRIVDLALAAAIDPVPQGRQADPTILGNRPSAAAAGQSKPHSLIPKLFRKACVGHGDPPASTVLSSFPKQVHTQWERFLLNRLG